MELEKCGDGDHSNEMQTALKRFEDVCNSLEDEHTKLLELEKRRQKLNEDLERLRNEIKEEKNYFRSVIDEQFMDELERNNGSYETEQLRDLVEPMTLDTGAIKEFIENQRDELASHEHEADINHIKDFKQYEVEYNEEQLDETPEKGDEPELTIDQMILDMDDFGEAQIDLDESNIAKTCKYDNEILDNLTKTAMEDLMDYLGHEDDQIKLEK